MRVGGAVTGYAADAHKPLFRRKRGGWQRGYMTAEALAGVFDAVPDAEAGQVEVFLSRSRTPLPRLGNVAGPQFKAAVTGQNADEGKAELAGSEHVSKRQVQAARQIGIRRINVLGERERGRRVGQPTGGRRGSSQLTGGNQMQRIGMVTVAMGVEFLPVTIGAGWFPAYPCASELSPEAGAVAISLPGEAARFRNGFCLPTRVCGSRSLP